jgi:chromosome segregation ATPase
MTDEPITLEFLARQQQRLLEEMSSMRDEMGTMRDDMQVLTAMVMRLDGTVGLVLTELRAMHSQHSRLANRVRRLEEQRDETP